MDESMMFPELQRTEVINSFDSFTHPWDGSPRSSQPRPRVLVPAPTTAPLA